MNYPSYYRLAMRDASNMAEEIFRKIKKWPKAIGWPFGHEQPWLKVRDYEPLDLAQIQSDVPVACAKESTVSLDVFVTPMFLMEGDKTDTENWLTLREVFARDEKSKVESAVAFLLKLADDINMIAMAQSSSAPREAQEKAAYAWGLRAAAMYLKENKIPGFGP